MNPNHPKKTSSPPFAHSNDGEIATPTAQAALFQEKEEQALVSPENAQVSDVLTVLRSETALSRFPLHRIAKKAGDIDIEITGHASALYWSVSHNSKYGQPGPLAYRIDTLLVNRRIEEAGKPVPRLIRLGSLPEIANELGISGNNWSSLRRALHQNASAYITAKINYRTTDRTEKFLEAGFNRYNIVFTGERLPTGEVASAVFLVLSDTYLEVLNTAVWRPLDYEYMKALSAGSQRFYEIVSYQIYAAVHFDNPRAKFLYSEYCLLSTATRYRSFEQVKKQMYKIVLPHIKSGYLSKIEYQAIVNEQNEQDWVMLLTPGPNASREYRAVTGKGKIQSPKSRSAKNKGQETTDSKTSTKTDPNLFLPFDWDIVIGAEGEGSHGSKPSPIGEPSPTPTTTDADTKTKRTGAARKSARIQGEPIVGTPTVIPIGATPPVSLTTGAGKPRRNPEANNPLSEEEKDALVEELVANELNRGDAVDFAQWWPRECRRQLLFLPFVTEFKTSRGAYLRRAIEEQYGVPAAYTKRYEEEQNQQRAAHQQAESLFRANQEAARKAHEAKYIPSYRTFLKLRREQLEHSHPEALTAFLEWERDQRNVYLKPPFANRPSTKENLLVFDREENHIERFRTWFCEKGTLIPTFWEWDDKLNPHAYKP
jgi:hypothetical protein